MTHHRERLIEDELKKMLTYSPCVGILGMRQVGKSTLLKKFANEYHSFDNDAFLREFEASAQIFLNTKNKPLALDEIQKYPPAFDALKFSVDELKKPGRFLISGSVRFSARKQIRESLTGRIILLEVMPLTLAECHNKKPSPFLSLIQQHSAQDLSRKLKTHAWATEVQILHYMHTGGLPGICFRRDDSIRAKMLNNHLDTLLGRDIQLIVNTKVPIHKLKAVLAAIAREQGLPVSYTKLARLASVSVPTIQNLLIALQGLFLIRPYGKTYYLEDAGLSQHLHPLNSNLTRADMIRCLYYELRTQFQIQVKHNSELAPYTTRGGIDVPLSFTLKNGTHIAMSVEDAVLPSDKSIKSLVWYKKRFPQSRLMILTRGSKDFTTTSDILCLPWTWVF